MPTPGRFRDIPYPSGLIGILSGEGASTFDMKAEKAGYCARFTALNTLDIYSVRVSFSYVSIGTGTMTLRLETIDTSTGKPTGTLYDANAVIASITPATGICTFTFASHPTTGLVVGTEYGLVLLTTAALTGATINTGFSSGGYCDATPVKSLTAADGTTRSNFAEIASTVPGISFVLSDASEDAFGMLGFSSPVLSSNIYTTHAVASKISVEHTIKIAGALFYLGKTGTPAGDVRMRIMDSGNNVIAGTTVTGSVNSMITSGTSVRRFYFSSIVTLQPGIYRIVIDSANCVSTSHCWRLTSGIPLSSNLIVNSQSFLSTTGDITATPIVWTDDATGLMPSPQFLLDDIPAQPSMARVRGGH